MPLFGSKETKANQSVDKSGSKSLGDIAPKIDQGRSNNMVGEKSVIESPSAMSAGNVQSRNNIDNPRPGLASPQSSKSFAAELDSTTVSSLPPSNRGDGSVSGSQLNRGASTTATSVTDTSPTDQSQKELVVSSPSEKEVTGSEGLIHDSRATGSEALPQPHVGSNLPEAVGGSNAPNTDTQKELITATRTESNVFSLPPSAASTTSRVYREYTYYNCSNFKDLVICDATQKPMLFAEIFSHTRSKSDVMLHDLNQVPNLSPAKNITAKEVANALVVAFADYVPNEIASQIRLGIGSPMDPARCVWVMMKNIQRDASSGAEKFDMTVSRAGEDDLTFQWIRNAGGDSETNDEASAKEAYRLVCGEETFASFRHAGAVNMRKRGALRVYEVPMAEQYLLLILLSASAMTEMYRRRRTKKIRKSFLIPF